MRKLIGFLFVVFCSLTAWSQGTVSGHVYEQDGVAPIGDATVTFSGYTLSGNPFLVEYVSDAFGHYEAQITPGYYSVSASAEGYEVAYLSDSLFITDGVNYSFDFLLHESYHPVRYVAARHYANDFVRLSWSMNAPCLSEGFETGDFSRFNWNNTFSDFPWAMDTLHAYEGSFCMKSTCEGQGEGRSEIEVSVYVPWSGEMGFQSRISSENNWDRGYFYIDDEMLLECSGEEAWSEHRYPISEGEHLFRWAYVKDANNDNGEDCFYVDDIHFFVEEGRSADRSFQYFELYRRRFDEEPVMLASHLADTVFMEMGWNSLPWGKYQWGVSCYYEGNRGFSDTVWSAYLDKEMVTSFELSATTNIGVIPVGAEVTLSSQQNSYQGVLDTDGHLLLTEVYRDDYGLRVHLDGFVDYVSDTVFPVFGPTQVEIELMEVVNGIDSMYVSSTGWAIWSFDEMQSRDLQYVEIMLNGEVVGTSVENHFQFDVDNLTEGDTCLAQVRPVYLSDTCDWRVCEWVYRPCSSFQGCTNLTWLLLNNAIQIDWSYPEGEVLGAQLYRNGDFIGFTEGDSFLDETELHGEVEYCLRVVYDGELDGTYYSMSCEECAMAVFPAYCDPPVKLDGMVYYENEANHGALISWGERPDPIIQWLHYDNGEFKCSLGGDGEPRIFWAVRFGAEELADYMGASLQKVSLYDVAAGTYQLWVYVGGDTAPRTLVRSQSMTLAGTQTWHEEAVLPAFEIPENEPIWVAIGQQGLARPAAACEDTGSPDGRWVSLDGETWTDMHSFNMHYTWMLRAYLSNRPRREMSLQEDSYSLQHYNLYRSYDNADYQQIATIPAVEGQLYYEYRDNLSDDPNEYVYYRLTAFYVADDNETCESDYAATLNDPDRNYVLIDVWSTNEKESETLHLYPNPTKESLTLEMEGMQQLSIANAWGQVLLSRQVNADVLHLDLSGYESGLYWLRVITQNCVLTRAFVVLR